ncbi:MAG TPA: YbaB/EbfC family nucleoid-associated protein [Candidatus Eisenbacteria bacterium]|nr:YbaB/EbfC family nucleoid-associated protein [Candidatus Eisenbacteria bacterium]
MFEKLKQFKDLRDKAKTLQSALATEKVTGEAAWGKVKIEMDGNQAVTGVTIDEALLAASEKSKLQDGVKDALNDALKKAQRKMMEKMKEMGGLNLPGMN